jgi:hypothetical protein
MRGGFRYFLLETLWFGLEGESHLFSKRSLALGSRSIFYCNFPIFINKYIPLLSVFVLFCPLIFGFLTLHL